LRFTRKNRMSVFLEPNVIRGYAYGFMCNPVWKWIMEKVWPQQYIYRLYTGWVRCHKSWLKMGINWMSMDYCKSQSCFFAFQHSTFASLRHNLWGSYTTSLVQVLLLSMLMLMLMLLSLPQVFISTTIQPAVFTETAFAVRGIYSLLCHGACLKVSCKIQDHTHLQSRLFPE